MIAHDTVGENIDTTEVRNPPEAFDETRPLLFVQEKRAMRNPADQMIAGVSPKVSFLSHTAYYSNYAANPTTLTPPLGTDPF